MNSQVIKVPGLSNRKQTKIILLICVAIFLGITSVAQDLEVPGVAEIRAEFNTINEDHGLKKLVLENEEFMENVTDGGGTLTCWYKKDMIVKIVEWIGLSYGNTSREFYFKGGKLIFIYCKVCNFVQKDNDDLDYAKTMTAFEGRYYIKDNKIIKVVINQWAEIEMGKDILDNKIADGEKYFKMLSKEK